MIVLEGIASNIPGEERALAHLNVQHRGQTYKWMIYIPPDTQDVDSYLLQVSQSIYDDIDAKEQEWEDLEPKTKTIVDEGQEVLVPIEKSEIVKPTIPDNYAIRRSLYPPIGDQLDAYWAGPGSAKYKGMMDKIREIKANHPVSTAQNPPEFVSATQIRLWLIENGYNLQDIENSIDAVEDEKTRLALKAQWEYAPYIERNHPFVGVIGSMLGLTSEQVNQAFTEAAVM